METKTLAKSKTEWPALFDKSSFLDRFLDFPLDASFNFGRVMNVPSINVNETDKLYKLSIAAPGLEKKDFDIQYNQGMLTISAEKEEKKEETGKFNRREYNYSSWSRSFNLPEDALDGDIKAEYRDGELKIEIPKSGNKKKHEGKHINVG